MSRILHHVGSKDFKKTRQRKIDEQKVLSHHQLKQWREAEAKRKQIEEAARPYKFNWRISLLREFGEWLPIDGGGPTNGTSQTFGYFSNGEPVNHYETGAQITYTASGLGGQDAYPSTVTIDFGYGEVFDVATPTYAQLALAGLALPMSFVAKNAYEEARKKYEEELQKYKEELKAYSKEFEKYKKELDAWYEKNQENQKNLSNYLKSLGTSWEDLRKNNWALQLGGPGGDIIGISNDGPDGYKVTVATQHPNAVGRIHFIRKNNDPSITGDWLSGFAVLKSEKTFSPPPRPVPPEAPSAPTPPDPNQYVVDRIQQSQSADEINQRLDVSQEFAQNVGADYMMGARIADDGSVILPDGSIYIELGPGGWQQSIISSPEDPAFKAGGGFAKIEQGYTYDQVLELGRKNIAAQVAQIEKQKPNTTAGFDTLKQPVVPSAGVKAVGKGGIKNSRNTKIPSRSKRNSPLAKQGETFLKYLTNKLPKVIDNKYLGQDYIDSVLRSSKADVLDWDTKSVTIGDNIIGSASNTSYNPKTDTYTINFNYDFETNAVAIMKDPEKYNYEMGLNRFGMNVQAITGGNYGLDASTVPGAGWLVQAAKSMGGGKKVKGKITVSGKRLEKLNPFFANQMKALHSQNFTIKYKGVQESTTWGKIKKYIKHK